MKWKINEHHKSFILSILLFLVKFVSNFCFFGSLCYNTTTVLPSNQDSWFSFFLLLIEKICILLGWIVYKICTEKSWNTMEVNIESLTPSFTKIKYGTWIDIFIQSNPIIWKKRYCHLKYNPHLHTRHRNHYRLHQIQYQILLLLWPLYLRIFHEKLSSLYPRTLIFCRIIIYLAMLVLIYIVCSAGNPNFTNF